MRISDWSSDVCSSDLLDGTARYFVKSCGELKAGKPILRSHFGSCIVCSMKMIHTLASEELAPPPKRRLYSPELKSQVIAQTLAALLKCLDKAIAKAYNDGDFTVEVNSAST